MKKLILITSLLLSSCANMPDFLMPNGYTVGAYKKMSVDKIVSKITIKHNVFEQVTEYTAPKFDGWGAKYYLRGWKDDKSKIITNQLYIPFAYSGDGWRFYKYAKDSDKEILELIVIDRAVTSCYGAGCSYIETLGITLTTKYLESHKKTGLQIKVSVENGYGKIFKVPANYVQAYLKSFN